LFFRDAQSPHPDCHVGIQDQGEGYDRKLRDISLMYLKIRREVQVTTSALVATF
jgi:hypothetical protein